MRSIRGTCARCILAGALFCNVILYLRKRVIRLSRLLFLYPISFSRHILLLQSSVKVDNQLLASSEYKSARSDYENNLPLALRRERVG